MHGTEVISLLIFVAFIMPTAHFNDLCNYDLECACLMAFPSLLISVTGFRDHFATRISILTNGTVVPASK